MREMMLISITILSCLKCMGQTSFAGIDLCDAVRSDRAALIMGHAVGGHWSVSASVSMKVIREADPSFTEHDEQFSADRRETVKDEENRLIPGIAAQFWPSGNFDGLMISFGITSTERICGSIAIGYLCRIWKGLRGGIAYRVVLNDTLRYGDTSSNGFRTGLCYTF